MDSDRLRRAILENAKEIVRLHSLVHETFRHRNQNPQKRAEWQQAAAEFRRRYDTLAFPGGYDAAFDRIARGEPEALEAAICFLECRPYFFRSGYMFKKILRRCRRAPLSAAQAVRLDAINQNVAEWRERKRRSSLLPRNQPR